MPLMAAAGGQDTSRKDASDSRTRISRMCHHVCQNKVGINENVGAHAGNDEVGNKQGTQ